MTNDRTVKIGIFKVTFYRIIQMLYNVYTTCCLFQKMTVSM